MRFHNVNIWSLRADWQNLVFLVILSVFFENSGFMKAGPRQAQFEPTEGKVVKFSDVHGVDEVKDVYCILSVSKPFLTIF